MRRNSLTMLTSGTGDGVSHPRSKRSWMQLTPTERKARPKKLG